MPFGSERDVVPLGTGFDIVKRGYSRTQVEEHLERLDKDLKLIALDRDSAVAQSQDMAKQMGQSRTEIADLRGQVNRLSAPPTTLEGLSERLQRMLRLAQDESNEIKARAEADASQIRARAEADATSLRTRYEKLIAEVDGRRVELENEHRELMERSHAEIEAKTKAADAARAKLDSEAAARRQQIEEDFEIAMSARRTESMRVLAEQEATSKAEAQRRVREATDEATRIRTQVNDEATTLRAAVAEEQRVSKTDAERRLRESTEEANRRRHEAATEAQARLQDATDEAHRRVREGTEEANQRIAAATARVEALRTLRGQLAEQLRAAHNLMVNASPQLDPLPEEVDVDAAAADDTTPAGNKSSGKPQRPDQRTVPIADSTRASAAATSGASSNGASSSGASSKGASSNGANSSGGKTNDGAKPSAKAADGNRQPVEVTSFDPPTRRTTPVAGPQQTKGPAGRTGQQPNQPSQRQPTGKR